MNRPTQQQCGDGHVVIVGGGPAGCGAAIRLGGSGVPVTLIDSGRSAAVGDALPSGSSRVLQSLGVLEAVAAEHLACHRMLSCWGSDRIGVVEHLQNPYGPGWHVDRRRFDALLRRRAEDAGVRLMRPARIVSATCSGGGFTLTVAGPKFPQRDLQCELLIDASGRSAALSRYLLRRQVRLDRLIGVAAVFSHRQRNDRFRETLVQSTDTGWWYTAPLPQLRRITIFFTDADLLRTPLDVPRLFQIELQRALLIAMTLRADEHQLVTPPRIVTATSQVRVPFTGTGWIAVGDAAFTVDPVSSQGLLNALTLSAHAADAVLSSLKGDTEALDDYRDRCSQVLRINREGVRKSYAFEQRFSTPFWQRRQQHAVQPGAETASSEISDCLQDSNHAIAPVRA